MYLIQHSHPKPQTQLNDSKASAVRRAKYGESPEAIDCLGTIRKALPELELV